MRHHNAQLNRTTSADFADLLVNKQLAEKKNVPYMDMGSLINKTYILYIYIYISPFKTHDCRTRFLSLKKTGIQAFTQTSWEPPNVQHVPRRPTLGCVPSLKPQRGRQTPNEPSLRFVGWIHRCCLNPELTTHGTGTVYIYLPLPYIYILSLNHSCRYIYTVRPMDA